jgi:hypothetical protein
MTLIGRLVALGALALLLGTGLTHEASAEIRRVNTPIATRVTFQGDNCSLSGGTFSSDTNPSTGSVSTYCQGGSLDGKGSTHCINTAKVVDCHIDRVLPPSGGGNGASGYGGAVSAEPGGTLQFNGGTTLHTANAGGHGTGAANHHHGGHVHGKASKGRHQRHGDAT